MDTASGDLPVSRKGLAAALLAPVSLLTGVMAVVVDSYSLAATALVTFLLTTIMGFLSRRDIRRRRVRASRSGFALPLVLAAVGLLFAAVILPAT
jgi:hypothetical protein